MVKALFNRDFTAHTVNFARNDCGNEFALIINTLPCTEGVYWHECDGHMLRLGPWRVNEKNIGHRPAATGVLWYNMVRFDSVLHHTKRSSGCDFQKCSARCGEGRAVLLHYIKYAREIASGSSIEALGEYGWESGGVFEGASFVDGAMY